MKKQHLFKRSRLMLLTLLAMIAGANPAWADTLTESFESLTVDGTRLSNGWFVQGGTLKSTVTSITKSGSWDNAGSCNYELITQGANNTGTSICNYESSNTSKYLIIPIELTGKIKFYAGGVRTSSGSKKVEVYRVTYNSETGVYTVGTKIGSTVFPSSRSSSSAAPNWLANKQEVDLGTEHSMVAFLLQASAIDEIEAEQYVYTPYAEPASISASPTSESAYITWTAGETDESVTAWDLEYKKTAEDVWAEIHGLSASSLAYTLSDLAANTSYDVRVKAIYGDNESNWATTTFKTLKVAVPATGFTDDFETDKGWDLVNGPCPNKWVRGTGTNNGGSYSLYISYDGTTYPTSSYGGSSLVYATKLFYFEAGEYTISYDWMCYGEGNWDFLRVGLVPASVELAASTSYSGLESGSTLPSGWTMFLDGGSKLGGSTTWANKSVDFTIAEAGSYQVVFAWRNDGSSGSKPAAVDNLKIIGSAPVLELGGDVVGTTLAFGSVSETTHKTIRITNAGKVAMENITLTETADEDNVFTYAALPKNTLDANESMDVQVTFSGSTTNDYTGTFRVAADNCDAIDVTVTATFSDSPAQMAITLGEEAVGATVSFGEVGKQTTKTFTVTNAGDRTLIISSIVSSNTTDFTVSPSSLTVQGGSSETFTVTFLYDENARDVEKTANITVTASNEGISPVTFAVTGTRIEQWSEDFSSNTLPDGWERTSTTLWTFADGVAKSTYSSTNYYLITPSLTVEEGASLSFDVRSVGTWNTLTIEKQLNGGSWTSCKDIASNADFGNDTEIWKTFTIDGLEAGNYKFRFNARNFWLDNFQGFKRNLNDPKLGIYSDAACTTAVATSVTKDFGFATAAQSATYYIKNDGTGTMTLSLGAAPDGITQSLDKTSVAAGEHATLTITMPAESKGYNGGNVVVTATNLGTFTVAVCGVIVEEGKQNLNFATDNIPATWTTNSWSRNVSGGYVEIGYSGSPVTMQTSNLSAVAGEELVVVAKMSYTSSDYTFGVKYKRLDADEWEDLIPAANIGKSYVMLHGTIAEAGTYQLQFNGQYTQIQRIYGLSVPQVPVMVVYDGTAVAADAYSFGNVSDEADAVKVFTVKNEGKAALTGLTAALSGDNADHYSVEVSATTVAVNQTATVTVRQLKDNIGAHAATLTISATGLDSKVIALSGSTYDHTKLFVDFEDGSLPEGWTKGSSWNVSQSSGNYSLAHSNGSTYASAVVTSPLTVAQGEVLTFGAARYYASSSPTLKVRYTADGGLTWSDYTDFSSEITSSYAGSTFKELTLTDVPAGTVVLEFYGNNVRLDNLYGFTPTTAPLLALTEGSTAVANNSTKDFGTLTAAATATYTLKNNGNGDMVSTVSTTGVATVAISGSDVTVSGNKVTVPAGKSATLTLTLPYEAPYGDKTGTMTISTEGWVADLTVNYTAATVDPTALYVDFANNTKPEGWYNDGWSFTSGYVSAAYVSNKQLITQKLACAGVDDVLSFDVWPYTSSYGTYNHALTVEYSTDRQNWTAFADQPTFESTARQTFQVKGAPAGEYYVRFTGSYVYMDNISGWHKVTGIDHDLYVSYTNIPSETKVPETSIQATATVYSLRADETGVYAKLFFGDNEIATAQAKDIAKDGSTNFSLTGNVPAEEGTYAARIVVYYSDNTVAFETLTTDVEVAHTRTLAVTAFALASDATAVADANNQFSPTFTVTVKNTGTTAVSVAAMVKDADGAFVGSADATEPLAAGSETTLTIVAENISAGEGGELSYYASAWTGNDEFAYATPVTINVTASAPKFALYQDATPVNNGDDIDFGLVREATTYHYIIKNEGTAALELISIEAPQGFTTTALTSSNKTIAQGGSLDIDVTLQAEQGKVGGNLVITYKVDAQTNKTFTLALSGRSISEDTWTVAFDGTQTQIPSDWTNNGGWQIAGEYSSYPNAAYSFGSASWLATPRLAATQGEQLTFDVSGSDLSLKVEYSTNFADWTAYETITTAGEHSFEAPAAGSYYLRFTGTYAYLTNFVGFRLDPYTATLADTRNFDATNYVMGPCAEATLGRSFGAGWGTLVLPFDVDAATVQDKFGEGTKLYTLTAYDDGELTFGRNTAGNIVAGTPYLVYLPAAIDANALVFENVVMGLSQNDVTINGAQFKGNYEAGMSMAGMYGVTPAGKMQKGGSNATMKAFRAYIVLPANVSAARIAIDETGTTGITRVLGDEQGNDEPAYNLQGQRVASPRKGFYIVGGKKVFKK